MTDQAGEAATPRSDATVRFKVTFKRGTRGRTRLVPDPEPVEPEGLGSMTRISSVARSLTRAHYYESLIRSGAFSSDVTLAQHVGLTTARLSQLRMLLNLAPDVVAASLDVEPAPRGAERVSELDLRRIALEPQWTAQWRLWEALEADTAGSRSMAPSSPGGADGARRGA